jgi:hypothetical protein
LFVFSKQSSFILQGDEKAAAENAAMAQAEIAANTTAQMVDE